MVGVRRAGHRRSRNWAVLGLAPFFLFVALFLLLPGFVVFAKALTGQPGKGFSLSGMGEAISGQYRRSFYSSLRLSFITALLGGVIGTLLAYAVITLNRPRWLRTAVTAFSGVAANLGGVPLAFAFISALGTQGLLTKMLTGVGLDLRQAGFTIFSFWGLVIVYLYFQIPLMLIVMAPAIDGLRKEWREAAANLGASAWQFWWRIGLRILGPSAFGGFLLLFANAFSAYATAYALTSGQGSYVSVQIDFILRGNIISGEDYFGYALAAWMIVIIAVAVLMNLLLQRRTARWLR